MSESSKQILQTGLYSTDPTEVEGIIDRVNRFNLNNIGTAIKLDVIPYEKGDAFVDAPHYKFRFLFPSKDAQRRFWTS